MKTGFTIIVALLIGRNLDDARQILGASNLAVTLEADLDRAIDLALRGMQTLCKVPREAGAAKSGGYCQKQQ